jgi:hypothetical protein
MDHTRMSAGWAWIRVRGTKKLTLGYWTGKTFQVVGDPRRYPQSKMINFIRIKYPENGWS